jgi:uncharacterized ubiquitin-like protein YukD
MRLVSVDEDGVVCTLVHKHTGRRVPPDMLLAQAGVDEGDTLRLEIERVSDVPGTSGPGGATDTAAKTIVDVVYPNDVDIARGLALPMDRPSSRVARKLAEKLNIEGWDSEHVVCALKHKTTERQFAPHETLSQAGVRNGDVLKLLVTGFAGGWESYGQHPYEASRE